VKQLKVEFLTLCDYAMMSQEGKLSVMGMFDRMFVRQVPSTFARFFIVAVLSGEAESEYGVVLLIQSPTGKAVVPEKELKVKLGTGGRTNIITDVVNFPLPEIGSYSLKITVGETEIGMLPFMVMQVSGQGGTKEDKLPN